MLLIFPSLSLIDISLFAHVCCTTFWAKHICTFFLHHILLFAHVIHRCVLYFIINAVFGCCKTFSGKYIFSGNANFRKRKMFPWCLVAFQKIFRKIFSGVWKRRRKTQIKKCRITQIKKTQATNSGKHKSRITQAN